MFLFRVFRGQNFKSFLADKMSLEAGKQFGHYKIHSPIGAGGMGEVFLAEDAELERLVALKILPDEFSDDAERLRRFVQEAKGASSLNHPNILTIYEIGAADHRRFTASEFISGETLRQKIRHLSVSETLDIAVQIVSALEAAHEAGIVHRDIKPENMMIRPYHIALFYNGLGESKETLNWLERGFEQREPRLVFLKVEPKWNNLRDDLRFQELLRKVGFPQ